MAFLEIPQIKIAGSTKPFGGFIYDMNYSVGFNGTPSSLEITLVNESGKYNFSKNDLSVVNTTKINIGSKSLNMHPVSFSKKNSSGGKVLKIKYLDKSIILDQYAVTQKYKHPDGGSCFALGESYTSSSSRSLDSSTEKYVLVSEVKKESEFDPNGKILYTPTDFLSVLKSKVSVKNESVFSIENYFIDYVGTFNEVLRKLSEDLAFSYYWSENDQLVFVDAKSPILINYSKINSISKNLSKTETFSIEDSYVNAVNGYYQIGRNVITTTASSQFQNSNLRKDSEVLKLERVGTTSFDSVARLIQDKKFEIPKKFMDNQNELASFIKVSLSGGIQYAKAYLWWKLFQFNDQDFFKEVYGIDDSEVNFFGESTTKVKEAGNYLRENNIIPSDYSVAAVSNISVEDIKTFSSDFESFLNFLAVVGRYYVRTVNSDYLSAYSWNQPFITHDPKELAKNTELKDFVKDGNLNITIEDLINDLGVQKIKRTNGGEFNTEPLSCILLDSSNQWAVSSASSGEDLKNVKNFYNSLKFLEWDIPSLNFAPSVPVVIIGYKKKNNLQFPSAKETSTKQFISMKGSRSVAITSSQKSGSDWKRIGKTNDARSKNTRNIKLIFKEFSAEQIQSDVSLEDLYSQLILRQDVENKKPDEKVNFSLTEFPTNDFKISDGLEDMSFSISDNGINIDYTFGTALQKLPSDSYVEQSYFNIHPTKSWKDIRINNKNFKFRQ